MRDIKKVELCKGDGNSGFRLAGSRPGHFLDLVLKVSDSCYFGLLHLVNPIDRKRGYVSCLAGNYFRCKARGLPGNEPPHP